MCFSDSHLRCGGRDGEDSGVVLGLGFVKIGVDAVVCEEGVVGSVFGDAAVVEDDDAVAEFAAAHAVGDVDSRFTGGHLAELFVDFGLSDRVEGCGRLVEDDERGILVEGAGDGGALGLAAGKVDTGAVVVVKAGADALRELLYTVGETDFCKRGLQSSFINLGSGGDVFVEREGKQVEILENDEVKKLFLLLSDRRNRRSRKNRA